MQMRNSPLAKTPPKNLPVIPGVTAKDTEVVHRENGTIVEEPEKPGKRPGPHLLWRKGWNKMKCLMVDQGEILDAMFLLSLPFMY